MRCCRQHKNEPEVDGAEHLSQHFVDVVKDVVAVLAIQAAEVAKNSATHAMHCAPPTGCNPFGYQYGGDTNNPMGLAGSSLSGECNAGPNECEG